MDCPRFQAKGFNMTANNNQPHPDRNEQQRIAALEAFAERLVKSEQKYRMIVEHANEAIIIIQNGQICFANPMAATVTGYSSKALLQIRIEELIHPEDRQNTLLMCNNTIQKETLPLTYVFRLIHKTGKTFWVQSNSVRIEWEGNPTTLILVRDISEQKKLEAQLFQAQKMEAIGNLAGGIAHDFNNILQAISGYAQILAINKNDSDPEYRKLEMILRSTQRGSELIKRLLIFSRKLESKLMPLIINSEVIQVCKILEHTLPKMIRIKQDLEEPIHTISADTVQIEQIMMNISVNALDAMPDGGDLTFSTRNVCLNDLFCNIHIGLSPGHHVLLTISDSGVGIDSDTLNHIFEPFYTTKKPGKGTGLGLAMVYGIVKNHNGYIICQSDKDQGTRFQIYFPVIEEERIQHPDKALLKGVPYGQETILSVDDEESI
jgi:two-component system cell cycle sensor histidine kinase/response regulator CckA